MAEKNYDTMSEIGISGLERYGGYVHEEFISELLHEKGIKIYNQMANNDPVIGAILFAISMLIRQADWNVTPASVDQSDIDAAEFIEDCVNNMDSTWTDTITEILSFLVFGWSWHEIVYRRRDDGKIGWAGFNGRSQSSWQEWKFSENGSILGMVQRAAPDYAERTIPIEKSLLFRTNIARNNPEGKSILRTAYRPWYFKKHIEQIQGVGIERDLAGLPVFAVPPNILSASASAEEKAILAHIKKIVTGVRRDEQEGLVIPRMLDDNGNSLYEFSLMSTGGSRQFDTKSIMSYYDQRIAMSVLADFVLLGHEGTGSFALSNDKTQVFSFAISSFVDIIQSTFNRKAIPDLLAMNGIKLKEYPKLIASDIEKVDLGALGTFLRDISGAGAELFPDEKLEDELRAKAKLPPKSTTEVL